MAKNLVISGEAKIIERHINRIVVVDDVSNKVKAVHDKPVSEEVIRTIPYFRVVRDYGFLELFHNRSEKIELQLDTMTDVYKQKEYWQHVNPDGNYLITIAEVNKFEDMIDSMKPEVVILEETVMTEKEYREHQKQKKGR